MVKTPPVNAGDVGLIPESERFPWRRKWQPTPVFLPGKSPGQRSLVGYSPWGCKELDTNEQLILFTLFRGLLSRSNELMQVEVLRKSEVLNNF